MGVDAGEGPLHELHRRRGRQQRHACEQLEENRTEGVDIAGSGGGADAVVELLRADSEFPIGITR
jgi:hypothetical protein